MYNIKMAEAEEQNERVLSDTWRAPAQALVFFIALTATLFTLWAPGMTWDEGIDAQSALRARAWFGLLIRDSGAAFHRDTVEKYWAGDWKEHPGFTRAVYALGSLPFISFRKDALYREWYVFRVVSGVMFALLAALVCGFAWRRLGGAIPGIMAAAFFICLPRVFGHAHHVATDLLLALLWFAAAAAFLHGLERPRGSIALGALLGLAPAVKLTGALIIVPLLLFGFLYERKNMWRNVIAALLLAPPVFILAQPMLWHDPAGGVAALFRHYTDPGVAYMIKTQYFGTVYHRVPPWTYPFAMIGFTTPTVTLVFASSGMVRAAIEKQLRPVIVFCVLNALFLPVVFAAGRLAAYDGERLFLPIFAFLAVLAGAGLAWVYDRAKLMTILIGVFIIIIGCAKPVIDAQPYSLSYYNELTGGLRGAARAGFEPTYWGDAMTPNFAASLNSALPTGARLSVIGYNPVNIEIFKGMKLLRGDIELVPYGREADFLLAFNRPGTWDPRTRYMFAHVPPALDVSHHGVRLAALFLLKPGLRFYR